MPGVSVLAGDFGLIQFLARAQNVIADEEVRNE